MKLTDIFEETYTALSANKSRSGLTILGIVIGISSVIVMVAIGQGSQASITSQIESMGSNLIAVTPGVAMSSNSRVSSGWGSAQSLDNDDLERLKAELVGVKGVAGELSGRYQVIANGNNTNTSVVGTEPAYAIVKNLGLASGDFISEQNLRNASRVAVLGPTVVEDLFGEGADPVGETVKINGLKFKIIGVSESKGGLMNQDDAIFIPLTTIQRSLVGRNRLSTIDIAAESTAVMSSVEEQTKAILLDEHDIANPDEADFQVMNQAEIVEAVSNITATLTLLLAAIAGISLVVGGIGIMNMMLTTVTERTREIGLRKALGAKRIDINRQFLFEAIVLTLLGGIIGITLGSLISFTISYFDLIQTKISVLSVVLAFGISAAIGIVFGYYPARRASALNPIEALRYE
ncbi:MAG TPA: ABC transporter permease [Candidatus Colwellbacteria bacterium]|nr:ABC transporter permease [Candidatus Colwellbacteria bacterium]